MPRLSPSLAIQIIVSLLSLAPVAVSAQVALVKGTAQKSTSAVAPAKGPVLQQVLIELETVRVLALSQTDGRAVLAFPDGIMVTAQSGELIPRTGALLKQVLAEKLILEQGAPGVAGKQIIWMHKAQGAKPGRVERFSSLVEPAPAAPAPESRTITLAQPGRSDSATPVPKP